LIIIAVFVLTHVFPAVEVCARQTAAYGEIKTAGNVQVESSTGRWTGMPDTYPLLSGTKLRTNDGIASITTKDGSKIDISRNTEIAVTAADSGYTIDLLSCTGTISFNMGPSALLHVNTSQAVISTVGGTTTNIQGMVTGIVNGTEVRSISGAVAIGAGQGGKEQRVLNTGESMFVSGECYPPAAGGTDEEISAARSAQIAQALLIGTFVTAGTIIALEAFRGDDVASPSGF